MPKSAEELKAEALKKINPNLSCFSSLPAGRQVQSFSALCGVFQQWSVSVLSQSFFGGIPHCFDRGLFICEQFKRSGPLSYQHSQAGDRFCAFDSRILYQQCFCRIVNKVKYEMPFMHRSAFIQRRRSCIRMHSDGRGVYYAVAVYDELLH